MEKLGLVEAPWCSVFVVFVTRKKAGERSLWQLTQLGLLDPPYLFVVKNLGYSNFSIFTRQMTVVVYQ